MGTLDNSQHGDLIVGGLQVNEGQNSRVPTETGQFFLVGSPINKCVTRIVSKPDREGQASAQRSNLLYETLQRKYTRKYKVYTNNPHVGPSQILQTVGVPYVGGAYPFGAYGDATDVYATCIDVKVVADPHHQRCWDVTAEFDTDRLLAQQTDNPLAQPPEIYWDSQAYEMPMRYDFYGIPCVSSSGNLFDPPSMVEMMRSVYRVVRNESIPEIPGIRQYNPAVADQYRRKLNLRPTMEIAVDNGIGNPPGVQTVPGPKFMDRDDGTVRINYINAHRALTNGILHWQVTYELEFRVFPDTFIENYLDQDYRDKAGNIFRDPRDQMPFTNQTPLNGRGRPIYEAKTIITGGMDGSVVGGISQVFIVPGDETKFPPPPKAPNTEGIIVGPDYYFYIRIDKEVMLVTKGADTPNWTVVRGQKGTVPVAHSNASWVYLEPYFLRFIPSGFADFSKLKLEGI